MPSLLSAAVALIPSRVNGHFTTMFLWILASLRPSTSIASASVEITSALMSPSTMSQIRRTCSSIGRPSLAISDGLVVTPSTIPQLAPFFNSSRFAVSRKNFTCPPSFHFSLHRARRTSPVQRVRCVFWVTRVARPLLLAQAERLHLRDVLIDDAQFPRAIAGEFQLEVHDLVVALILVVELQFVAFGLGKKERRFAVFHRTVFDQLALIAQGNAADVHRPRDFRAGLDLQHQENFPFCSRFPGALELGRLGQRA